MGVESIMSRRQPVTIGTIIKLDDDGDGDGDGSEFVNRSSSYIVDLLQLYHEKGTHLDVPCYSLRV